MSRMSQDISHCVRFFTLVSAGFAIWTPVARCATQKALYEINSLTELSYDHENRLRYHYMAVDGPRGCVDAISPLDFSIRQPVRVQGVAAETLFPTQNSNSNVICSFACLERGTHQDFIDFPLESHKFSTSDIDRDLQRLADWYVNICQKVEIGFILYGSHDADIFWVNSEGNRFLSGVLQAGGELYTEWRDSYMGHKFVVVEHETYRQLALLSADYNCAFIIGKQPQNGIVNPSTIEKEVYDSLLNELPRAREIRRTFTQFGFTKGRLPPDLWGSISAYYYNNRHHKFVEEWEYPDMFVNWWESNVYMIPIPWALKKYWQKRLQILVENWSNTSLEPTDIYGMREYTDGARLLTHADRTETHAVSLIINIAQSRMRIPWTLEIYDHADRLHEVSMDEGDIVFYESARCLHGRMRPLKGSYYVNMFVHYRPVGDPEWFTRVNPAWTVSPVLNIGKCIFSPDGKPHCVIDEDENGIHIAPQEVNVPFLSPSFQQLSRDTDLFEFWLRITNEIAKTKEARIGILAEEV